MAQSELEFLFEECIEEIQVMSKLAAKFIEPESLPVFDQLSTTLRSLRDQPRGRPVPLEIRELFPIRTRQSAGCYERGGGGKHRVFAKLTSIWDIEPCERTGSRKKPREKFALAGKASSMVRIYAQDDADEGKPRELAMWRMEIGSFDSPGCHFHVQILGERDEVPFPHSLSIPRFPSLIVTPMHVLEFVLAELFQDEWKQHAAYESAEMQRWQRLQRKRLHNLLQWQLDSVNRLSGSPWTALKCAKPSPGLFLSDRS